MSDFQKNLKKIMVTREVRPVDLANKTGISKSSISQYLSGNWEPTPLNLFKIAAALETTPEALMYSNVDYTESNKQTNKLVTSSSDIADSETRNEMECEIIEAIPRLSDTAIDIIQGIVSAFDSPNVHYQKRIIAFAKGLGLLPH